MNNKYFVERLKQRLLIEFKKQDRSGVYGYTQRSMAYNSNKIEGSTLTEKQTASMFDTGTLYTDDTNVILRTKDIEEMNGHFKMFNYIMKNMDKPLSEDLIKGMHKNLKEGVFEDFANGYAVGDWKKRENRVSDINVALPQEVPDRIYQLLNFYICKENIELKDIVVFHAKFENIHPFQDGNGRVGRMIILKQCLDNDIVPVIIRDSNKAEYYRFLNKAQHEEDYNGLIRYFEKEQQYYMDNTMQMLYTLEELDIINNESIDDAIEEDNVYTPKM